MTREEIISMTDREAMKLALEAMKYADACLKKQLTTKTKHEYAQDLLMDAGVALRTAIAEAEKQEPVACVGPWHDARLTLIPRYSGQVFERDQPLYARPQSTAWRGLTDEEMHECWGDPLTPLGMKHARMIEAKLREKNT